MDYEEFAICKRLQILGKAWQVFQLWKPLTKKTKIASQQTQAGTKSLKEKIEKNLPSMGVEGTTCW